MLATKNRGKIEEFISLLRGVFQKIMTLTDLDSAPDIVEDGNTFRENALKKARFISEFTQKLVLADDSGLEVEALGGRPGIFSSRYAGEGARDKDNIDKLLRELSGLSNRKGRFVCSIALVSPDGKEIVAEGACEGIIIDEPRGESGFGYDPVFLIPEMNKTFAELGPEEKNRISHRARAVKALISLINRQEGL
ncbi:MAG: XTP/dITP diphosphatase [Ignavibacteriales bacterium]